MKISLITVTYNSCITLKDTIESVRRQGLKELEYIIVDGGSADGTVELLSQSTDVVTRWISEPDKGIYDGLNKGVAMATGDLIGIIHADDVLAVSDTLKSIISVYESNPFDLLYADLMYVSAENPDKVIRYWKSGLFEFQKLRKGWMPPHPTVYFSRDVLNRVGYFDTTYAIAADYDWMLRCLSLPDIKVAYLPQVTVKMRLGGASNRSLKNLVKKSYEDYKAIKRHSIGGIGTLFYKNFSKLGQFVSKAKTQ